MLFKNYYTLLAWKKTIKKLKNCHRQFLLDNDLNSRLFVIILYSDTKIFYIIYTIL